jgi:hypothetical protein
MLNKYITVFSDTINEKPIAGTPMKFHLRDNIQINPQKCYVARATPVHQQAAATKLEQELEASGIIHKRTEQPDPEADAPVPRST